MITSIVGSTLALFLIIISVPGIIGGIGLLKYKYWAKILVIILGILNLFNIPIGTIVGVYTLWVLFNSETDKIFLDIPFEESKKRAKARDMEEVIAKYEVKYLPAQGKYLKEYPPQDTADMIIDNTDWGHPVINFSR